MSSNCGGKSGPSSSVITHPNGSSKFYSTDKSNNVHKLFVNSRVFGLLSNQIELILFS